MCRICESFVWSGLWLFGSWIAFCRGGLEVMVLIMADHALRFRYPFRSDGLGISSRSSTTFERDRGENCIWIHQAQPDGTLTLVDKHVSSRPHDGPRHAVVGRGETSKVLYAVSLRRWSFTLRGHMVCVLCCSPIIWINVLRAWTALRACRIVSQVTEHTQFVDVYDLTESGLSYVHSSSLIPAGESKFW